MIVRYFASYSVPGLVGAALFFAVSLAPSLIPRTPLIQGLLSGVAAATGYWAFLGLVWIWKFFELPLLRDTIARITKLFALTVVGFETVYALWLTTSWQDSLHEFLELEPLERLYTPIVLATALTLAIVLRESGRALGWLVWGISKYLDHLVPRRVSIVASLLIAAFLLVNIGSGMFGRFVLEKMDAGFLALDQLIEDDLQFPGDVAVTGGPGSLLTWEQLGRQGRRFIATAPSAEDISAFLAAEAKRPIRVYVGLGAGKTSGERAFLALAELKRVGAFERKLLVIATPTGTGWIDEAAIGPLEYLHAGDTAVVAQQYSYLSSYISIMVEPGYAKTSATALFNTVYDYWKTLPKGTRPRLYLQGLSLGSLGSEQSMNIYHVLGDLIDGAVWSGPPFNSPDWMLFTRDRNSGSPVWLPTYGDGSLVRFTNQKNALDLPGASWGPVRLVYLQYASDPVTFFAPELFFREPEWLKGPRGPDVSPDFIWYPIVTALQVIFDMIGATEFGPGLGHSYAASHYIDAWVAVTEPAGWTYERILRLKNQFSK